METLVNGFQGPGSSNDSIQSGDSYIDWNQEDTEKDNKLASPSSVVKCNKPSNLDGIILQFIELSKVAYEKSLFQQCLDSAEKALSFCERSHAVDSLSLLPSIHFWMAKCSGKLGKTKKAVSHWRLYLDLLSNTHEISDESNNSKIIYALETMVTLLRKLKDYKQAEETATKLITMHQNKDDNRCQLADALTLLADILASQERYERAIVTEERAVRIRLAALGSGHRDTAHSLRRLAGHLIRKGDYGSSTEVLLRRSLDILQTLGGVENISCAPVLGTLAELFVHRGRLAAAEDMRMKEIRLRRNADKITPQLVIAQWSLASLIRGRGDVEKACDMRCAALRDMAQLTSAGTSHPKYNSYKIEHEDFCLQDANSFA
eukprot:gene889-1725_t